MKKSRTLLLLGSLGVLTTVGSTACGKKSGDATTNVVASTDPNTFVDPDTGATYGISSEPHPAECSADIPATPGFATVANCDPAIGTVVPSEGLCFVQDSVQPQWTNEPPSSGPQYTFPEFQYYRATTPVPRGRYVRSLAHGYVVVVYNCPAGCAQEANAMADLITGPLAGTPTILTEDPLLHTGTRFAAMAWNYAYTFDAVDAAKLSCFVQQHAAWGLVNHVGGGTTGSKVARPGQLSPAAAAANDDDL